MQELIPSEYRGWWRIVETSQWVSDRLDFLGPALISLTGTGDRLRMHALLAYVNCKPTKSGVSFTWQGAWEFDQMSGSGRVTLGRDGRLRGVIKIKGGDSSNFIAERSVEPNVPIPDPRATETSGESVGKSGRLDSLPTRIPFRASTQFGELTKFSGAESSRSQ